MAGVEAACLHDCAGCPHIKATVTHPPLGSSEVERHLTQGFVDSIEGYFTDYLSVAGLRPGDLHGLSVLELGSGDSYGVALKFIQHGARRVVCTDRFKSQRSMAGETRVHQQLLEAAGSETERGRLSQAVQCTDASFAIDDRWIQTLIAPAEQLDQYLRGEQFDLIISRATLEHVYDLEGVFRSISALLRPGGRTVHMVDFENHDLFATQGPVYFLRFPRWLCGARDLLYSAEGRVSKSRTWSSSPKVYSRIYYQWNTSIGRSWCALSPFDTTPSGSGSSLHC